MQIKLGIIPLSPILTLIPSVKGKSIVVLCSLQRHVSIERLIYTTLYDPCVTQRKLRNHSLNQLQLALKNTR